MRTRVRRAGDLTGSRPPSSGLGLDAGGAGRRHAGGAAHVLAGEPHLLAAGRGQPQAARLRLHPGGRPQGGRLHLELPQEGARLGPLGAEGVDPVGELHLLDAEADEIVTDAERLRQALVNLLVNAREAARAAHRDVPAAPARPAGNVLTLAREPLRLSATPSVQLVTCALDEASGRVTLRHPAQGEITFRPDDAADLPRFLEWVRPLNPENRAQPVQIVSAGT